jgi:spore photoproduct lyase
MWDDLKLILEKEFSFSLNRNQFKDIKRLIYEICIRDSTTPKQIFDKLKNNPKIKKVEGRNKFFAIKSALISLRFPLTSKKLSIDAKNIYLCELRQPLRQVWKPKKQFVPEKIFIEKEVKQSRLASRFKKLYPQVEIEELDYSAQYLKRNKFNLNELKRPLLFIVKERWDFLKPCPCTKGHLGCNYWIFNLGMGCPYDCSYCYLQCYANFPGITLPANLNDFFEKFDTFYKKLAKPIRIGTGEFCDSLALDEITEYSLQLIDYFGDKNLFFELKTKSNKIKNILEADIYPNIVIAWSLNPQKVIDSEEVAVSSLEERIQAAKSVQEKGFNLAFHFDPIIYYNGWQQDYKHLVAYVYQNLKPPFRWISLGTLRSNRELKSIVERRFPESRIFYGELFLGEDKKLRYPKFLRKEIYKNMIEWIRDYDSATPVYLCMEDKEVWQDFKKEIKSSKDIEKYLLKGCKNWSGNTKI